MQNSSKLIRFLFILSILTEVHILEQKIGTNAENYWNKISHGRGSLLLSAMVKLAATHRHVGP